MKIAVSSKGPGLADAVDPRLGRCEYLLIVDSDTMQFEALANENKDRGGGAGIQTASTIAERGAAVVLTGNCGPNAYETLSAAGVQVITGMSGTVRDALDRYKRGEVAASGGPSVESHAGLGVSGASTAGPGFSAGQGTGAGMGSGRRPGGGRGPGCGRGMGGGGGRGMGAWSADRGGPAPAPGSRPPAGGSDEVSALRQKVQQMSQRLGEVLERLGRLEKN